jgi:hypothetical protein
VGLSAINASSSFSDSSSSSASSSSSSSAASAIAGIGCSSSSNHSFGCAIVASGSVQKKRRKKKEYAISNKLQEGRRPVYAVCFNFIDARYHNLFATAGGNRVEFFFSPSWSPSFSGVYVISQSRASARIYFLWWTNSLMMFFFFDMIY